MTYRSINTLTEKDHYQKVLTLINMKKSKSKFNKINTKILLHSMTIEIFKFMIKVMFILVM